jgi:SAM-dependent methyltransferase
MPLQDLERIRRNFICPRCKEDAVSNLRTCNACGLQLGLVCGKPILVDFDTSVLNREQLLATSGESYKERKRSTGLKWALKLMYGENRVAQKQIQRFLQAARELSATPSILIIGGGAIGSGLDKFYAEPGVQIIGFDIYASENVQFIADAHKIPLQSRSIDGVVVQAVLEHVIEPQSVIREIERVLRSGGVVYADTPFLQHVHEGAYDFTRFTEGGHRNLFRNFGEISSGAVGGPGTQMMWSIDYLFRSLFRSRAMGRLVRALFFWLRWLDSLVPENYAIDAAPGCYFLGTLSDTPILPKELIRRYKGAQ